MARSRCECGVLFTYTYEQEQGACDDCYKEALKRRIEVLEKALKPLADYAKTFMESTPLDFVMLGDYRADWEAELTKGDCVRAAEVLGYGE